MQMGQIASEQKSFLERRSLHLLATTQRTLWPLVKLLLHRGIGYPVLAEALKSVFVGVAQSEFPLGSKRDTDSRISLLTGIHRRDVRRLRLERVHPRALSTDAQPAAAGPADAVETSLPGRVIAVWSGLASYLDERGRPLPLPRLARKGGECSFEALVQSLSKDMRPRALLDEWLRRGVATIDEEDRVHLDLEMVAATRDLDDSAFSVGQNIHDHVAAIAHNLTGEEPAFPERCVAHGQLTQDSVEELAALARQESSRAMQAVERLAIELAARDAGNPLAQARMSFGVYFYSATSRSSSRENDEGPALPDDRQPESRERPV